MGEDWDSAHAVAEEALAEGDFLVHPHAQVGDEHLHDDLRDNLDQEDTWEGHASLVAEVAEVLGRPPACLVAAVIIILIFSPCIIIILSSYHHPHLMMIIIILLILIILIDKTNTILIKKMLIARWEEEVLPWVSPEVLIASRAPPFTPPGTRQGDDFVHDNEDEQLRLLAVETRGAACLGESLSLGKRVTDQILNFDTPPPKKKRKKEKKIMFC